MRFKERNNRGGSGLGIGLLKRRTYSIPKRIIGPDRSRLRRDGKRFHQIGGREGAGGHLGLL